MNYQVEDVSPTRKTVQVSVDKEEVNAAIAVAVKLYNDKSNLAGYRKGKIPTEVLYQRYGNDIINGAKNDLIHVHVNSIFQDLKTIQISSVVIAKESSFEINSDYNYTIEFDVLPEFELPNYEGVEAEELELPKITPEFLNAFILKLRRDHATYKDIVDKNATPADGDLVFLDFSVYKDGISIKRLHKKNFPLLLGNKGSLKEFESFVKTLKIGERKEIDILMPKDFLAPEFANQTLHFNVRLVNIQAKTMASEEELQKIMGVSSHKALLEISTNTIILNYKELYKSECQNSILENLLKQVDFPVPESMMKAQLRISISNFVNKAEREGKYVPLDKDNVKKLEAAFLPEATVAARSIILLLAIAKKEGLTVSDKEVQNFLLDECKANGMDYKILRQRYEDQNLYMYLVDKLLSDKASELIYSRAKITMISEKEFLARQEAIRKAQEEAVRKAREDAAKKAEEAKAQETAQDNQAKAQEAAQDNQAQAPESVQNQASNENVTENVVSAENAHPQENQA
ncbi:MAG: trigger factor [Desulfovibrionaceae bacterium]|nr:trigger factor [Desulfovibrionaceae bacterium]